MQSLNLSGKLRTYEQIIHEPLPPTDWLIEPLIAQGDRVVIYGEFGVRKSWMLLDVALHLAAGKPWAGHFVIPQPRTVLYIDEEMAPQELQRRVQRLARGAGLEEISVPLYTASRLGLQCSDTGIANLQRELAACAVQPGVIIVEALRRVIVGNENEAADIGKLWKAIDPLVQAGTTIILSHHMKKPPQQGGGDIRHRASGSTDIQAGADAAYAVTRCGQDVIALECTKLRTAEEPKPFLISFNEEAGREGPVTLRYEGAREDGTGQTAFNAAVSLILRVLSEAPEVVFTTATVMQHLAEAGVNKTTTERALSHCRKLQLVDVVARGQIKARQSLPVVA
ncbi:MAG: AAA family ATPase [Nitrospirota bacterium]|nr:AAA family ATPase [Nitrospirota bacterium]